MYKLVAIDLDGTLLNDEKNIPKDNIRVINKLMDKGIEVIFATGRRYLSAKNFIKVFKEDMVIIANNGNIIRHSKDDKLEMANYLSSPHIRQILEKGKEIGIHPVFHVNRFEEGIDMLVEDTKDGYNYSGYLDKEDRFIRVDKFKDKDFSKVLSMVYIGELNDLSRLKRFVDKNYPNDFTPYLMTNVHLAEALLEFCDPKASKWTSIMDYSKTKGIKPEEIVVLGDDINDLDMIRSSGLGIAMKNAVDKVKDEADIVTKKDNNQGGVAQVLSEIFNIRELD